VILPAGLSKSHLPLLSSKKEKPKRKRDKKEGIGDEAARYIGEEETGKRPGDTY